MRRDKIGLGATHRGVLQPTAAASQGSLLKMQGQGRTQTPSDSLEEHQPSGLFFEASAEFRGVLRFKKLWANLQFHKVAVLALWGIDCGEGKTEVGRTLGI